jgi:hypothetical protein
MNPGVTSLEDTIIEKLRTLPPERQQEVLDFVEFIQQRVQHKQPRQSVKGLWKDLIDRPITAEDIAESRREMLKDFPGNATGAA